MNTAAITTKKREKVQIEKTNYLSKANNKGLRQSVLDYFFDFFKHLQWCIFSPQ